MTDRQMTSEQQSILEDLVDACGLDLVLTGLASMCAAKSDHAIVNWQDRSLANAWMQAMTECDKTASKPSIIAVS